MPGLARRRRSIDAWRRCDGTAHRRSPRACRSRCAPALARGMAGARAPDHRRRPWPPRGRRRGSCRCRNPSACSRRCTKSPTWPAPSWRCRRCSRRIHAVVGGLMSAENFYIVLYDDNRADRALPVFRRPARPLRRRSRATNSPLEEMPNSLTVALLRHGQPLLGPSDAIRRELGVPRDVNHGPDSADWLGVPMRRDGRVCGAIVVQSYDTPASYTRRGPGAARIRRPAHPDRAGPQARARRPRAPRRRAHPRTAAGQPACCRRRSSSASAREKLQRALYRITELSVTSDSLERFYADVHAVVDELLYARNFYIALLSPDGETHRVPVFGRRTRPRSANPAQARQGPDRIRAVHAASRCWPTATRIAELEAAGQGAQLRPARALLARRAAVRATTRWSA